MESNKPISRVSVKGMLKKYFNLQNDNDTKALLKLVHAQKMRLMMQILWSKMYGAHVPVKNRWKNTGERIDDKRVCAKKSPMVRFYERVEKELVMRLGANYNPPFNLQNSNKLNMSFQLFY